MDKLLRDVYYNAKSPACYSSLRNVYREAKRRNKKIDLNTVRNFLARQDTYTLHRNARKRFKRNKTRTAGIDVHWQTDLADMKSIKRHNSGYTFIVVCIDVLSRFAFAEPVKKKTPEQVGDAIVKMIKTSGRKPWFLMSDRGREYTGKVFKDRMESLDIQHWYASSPDVKCAIVERYMRTLKSRLWRYFTRHKTLRYVDVLQDLVKSINNSHHRTIGCAPAKVDRNNQHIIWERLFGEDDTKPRYRFKQGDLVRITKEKSQLHKGYLPNYTTEVFQISQVLKNRKPATYRVCDLNGEDIEGIFYNEELVKVENATRKRKR